MNRRIARHFFRQASPVNWLTCPLCFCIAPLCGTPMKNRASLFGGQSGASEKNVHHFFWELGPHFDKCIAFPENKCITFFKKRASLFGELGPHFDECIAFPEKRASPFSKRTCITFSKMCNTFFRSANHQLHESPKISKNLQSDKSYMTLAGFNCIGVRRVTPLLHLR